jgi:thiamine transport system permease protein
VAVLALGFYIPLGRVFADGLRENGRWTLTHVRDLLADPYILRVIGFTWKQAALSTLLAVGIGVPGAYLLARFRFPGRRIIRGLTLLPFVMPPVAVALGFVLFWGRSGAINRVLMEGFGVDAPPVRVLYSMWGIVLAHAFYNAPVVSRIVGSVWEGLDPAIDEAAISLGRGPTRRFFGVTLPLLAPALLSASALVFILCFLSFPIVLALGGARFATLEVEIYTVVRALLDVHRGGALILIEAVLSLGLAYVYLRSEAALAVPTAGQRRAPLRPLLRWPPDPARAALIGYAAVAVVFFAGPIVAILVDSLRRLDGSGWTLAHYRYLAVAGYSPLLGSAPWKTILNSMAVAGASSILAVPLGFATALFGVRSRLRVRHALEALLMVPLGVSSVAVGYAVLRGLGTALPGLRWWVVLAIAHGLLHYPFVARILRPTVEAMDPEIVEAARSLGAGRLRRLAAVEIPAAWRGLVAGLVFSFALSMGEMSAAIVLSRPGAVTLPVAVHGLLAAREFGAASAMAEVLIAVTGLCFVVVELTGAAMEAWRWRS